VLMHGDIHGDNHLWDEETLRLRLVIDLETVGTGEPEFDLRCLPGDCGIDLFTATVAHYEKLTGTKLDVDRIMAWYLRTVLGDALWRAEAGIPLPDKRTRCSGWTTWPPGLPRSEPSTSPVRPSSQAPNPWERSPGQRVAKRSRATPRAPLTRWPGVGHLYAEEDGPRHMEHGQCDDERIGHRMLCGWPGAGSAGRGAARRRLDRSTKGLFGKG
jgi:phosphotransferase family enzyme